MKGRNNSSGCWTRTDLLRATFTSRVITVGLIRAIQWGLLPAALSPTHHTNSSPHSSALGSVSKAAAYQPDGFSSGKSSLMHFSTACFWKLPKTLISCLPKNSSIPVIKLQHPPPETQSPTRRRGQLQQNMRQFHSHTCSAAEMPLFPFLLLPCPWQWGFFSPASLKQTVLVN